MKRVADGPAGQRWVVRRRWAPRLGPDTLFGRFKRRITGTGRRSRELIEGLDAVPDGCVDAEGLLVGIVVAIVLVVVGLLLIFVVIPLLVALVDLLILLLLALLGILGRIVFRRPWTIEARADDGTIRTWKVVGWRASRDHRDEIAQLLAAGITPPPDDTPAPTIP